MLANGRQVHPRSQPRDLVRKKETFLHQNLIISTATGSDSSPVIATPTEPACLQIKQLYVPKGLEVTIAGEGSSHVSIVSMCCC